MTLGLQDFVTQDTGYIAKLNNNNAAIESFATRVQAQNTGAVGAAVSWGEAFRALFGPDAAVVGATSYACSGSGSTLTVQPGYAWSPSAGVLSRLATSTTISFSGVSAGTYYIRAAGGAQRVTSSTDALYSVVWSGAAFGAITRLAAIVWGAADWTAAQTSSALSATYTTLDARFEAVEALVGGNTLARTNQAGRLAKSVAGGVNVTLTGLEANNAVIELTGAVTGAIDVIVPVDGPRTWLVINSTTGNYRITLKASGQTGFVLPGSGGRALAYHNGTDTRVAIVDNVPLALPSSSTLAADFARAELVRCTLAANSTITLSGARDGQRCTLEVSQNGTGGYSLSFGAEINFGTDLASITLDTSANARNYLGFVYNAGAAKYDLVALTRGF